MQFSAYTPFSGNGMIGLILGTIQDKKPDEYREFIQMKLKRKLKQNETIYVKFRINKNWPLLAFPNIDSWDIISFNEIGVNFLNDSIIYEQPPWIAFKSDWINTSIKLSEIKDWTSISFKFSAKGGEEWVVIGNFYPEQNFPYKIEDSILLEQYSSFNFYLSIDQFTITTSPLPNVFTPNNDGINDKWVLEELTEGNCMVLSVEIFNRWGKSVFDAGTEFTGWDGYCNRPIR